MIRIHTPIFNIPSFKLKGAMAVFCLVAAILAFTVQCSAQANNPQQAPVSDFCVNLDDIDGDGITEAVVETPLISVTFSGKTGEPSSFYLKGKSFNEYIYPPIIKDLGYTVATDTCKPFVAALNGLSGVSSYNIEAEEGPTPDTVVVKATANVLASSEGEQALALSKKYTFHRDTYRFSIECLVTNLKERLTKVGDEANGSITLSYGPGLFMDPFGPVRMLGLKTNSIDIIPDAAKLTEAGAVAGAYNGIGIRDQYFCVLLEAEAETKSKISASAFEIKSGDKKQRPQNGRIINCVLPAFNLGAKETRSFGFKVFAGPMILEELKKINRPQVSEYGFLSTILLRILQFFYSIIPNYGLAIIFLTLAVRLILYPLTLKQTKSMAQMQKIQPMLQNIKDRYKDNPQKFNEEVLKLYQENNVNPLGGCLPLLLQLPVLVALYNTIRIAVELRKVSFLWISDLSKADPLIILPFAIAALMYYQQTKMATDPQQQQMMAFMPIFMFAITFSLPAGLLIYWFASSVLGLIQQLHANRITAAIKKEERIVQNN